MWRTKSARITFPLFLGWPLLPLLKVFGDDLHGRCGRLVEAGIIVNFPTDADTLIAQHVAHAFQVENNPVNVLHGICSNVSDYLVQLLSRLGRCLGLLLGEQRHNIFYALIRSFRWTRMRWCISLWTIFQLTKEISPR